MEGDLTIIAGPSGVGKGTLVAHLRRRCPSVWVSVSVTTREPRPGEVDGVAYHFIDDSAFDRLVESDGLLEWAQYGPARYGTPAAPVREALARGARAVLEIEVCGARQVRQAMPDARFILIVPPDLETLAARLRGRGTESPEQIERRLRAAERELAARDEFDHVVVNAEVGEAVDQLVDLMGLPRRY